MPDRSRDIDTASGESMLGDFLGHGVLPFVGRDREMTSLTSFWHAALESPRMRCALLSGEAGIGKSRLINEFLRLPSSSSAIIHLRLYPDSDTAPAPLLAHAIAGMQSSRSHRIPPPDGSIASVRDALRRISNLRRTLVVIEDIHLLRGETLRDFAILLDVISELPLSILMAARPLDDAIRGTIEPWLVEEIRLEGLKAEAFHDLWRRLFGEMISEEIVSTILSTTLGNPLALRSGLRGSLKAGVLTAGVVNAPDFLLPDLARNLERQVQILSAGMTAHLDRSERDAALLLASLGEVFAPGTARTLLGEMSPAVEALLARGIIIVSGSSRPPLSGTAGDEPLLAFTHSLLHRELARLCKPDPERILDLILAGYPLHSTLPFQLLLQNVERIEQRVDRIPRAVRSLLKEAARLNQTTDWTLGEQIWRTADGLQRRYGAEESMPVAAPLRPAVITTRLVMLARDITSEEHRFLLDELEQITDGRLTEEMVCYRIDLLRHRLWGEFHADDCSPLEVLGRMEDLVEGKEWLLKETAFILYLRDFANMVSTRGEVDAARRVEAWLERIMNLPGIDQEQRSYALQEIAPNLFWFFMTPEELQGRLELIARVEAVADQRNVGVAMWKTLLLEKIGRIDDAVSEARKLLPRLQANGQTYLHYIFQFQSIVAGASRGEPLDPIEQHLRALLASAPAAIQSRLRSGVALRIVTMSLLCGDIPRALHATEELLDGRTLWGVHAVLMALESGDLDGAIATLFDSDDTHLTIQAASRIGDDDTAVRLAAMAEVIDHLESPVLRTDDILVLRAIIGMVDRVAARNPGLAQHASLDRGITDALERAMEWLARTELAGYMTPVVDIFEAHFTRQSAEQWRARIAGMKEKAGIDRNGKAAPRVRLTMLGRIEATIGDTAPVALRIGRLRTLAGVLVADRILQKPLSHTEICRIVAGSDTSAEQARKGMNVAVHRLREILGHDAIDTTGATPRLVTGQVEVDLLEVYRLLEQSDRMIADGHVALAQHALLAALGIVNGEVPFPGLYDNFFEASREDFDSRLRSAVVTVAGRLLGEGEIAGAEEILRVAFEGMPEDEEIAALLCDTMIQLGDRTGAERVRMRVDLQQA